MKKIISTKSKKALVRFLRTFTMAARIVSQIIQKNADKPQGKKKRKLQRTTTYLEFLKSHNPHGLNHVLSELAKSDKWLDAGERKQILIVEDEAALTSNQRKCVHTLKAVRDSAQFKAFITTMIFLACVLVGIQTYTFSNKTAVVATHALDQIVLWVFLLEVTVKIGAEGIKPWVYFFDGWNVFDFCIVTASFLPLDGGQAVMVFRLLRLMRLLKLVRALPKLQILVIGLFKSLSSIVYIGMLMLLQFFLFAVVAVLLFGKNDPDHVGNLHVAFLTLFRCATLEDWTDVMYISMYGCANYGYGPDHPACVQSSGAGYFGALYWILFILISTYMIINLFIGVITTSMGEAKQELANAEKEAALANLKSQNARESARMQQYMLGRLLQIEEVVHTLSEEFEELAVKEKERVSDAEIFLRSNRNLDDGGA